jgi:putative transposase
MPIQNWNLTLSQLAIFFEGRLEGVLKLLSYKYGALR